MHLANDPAPDPAVIASGKYPFDVDDELDIPDSQRSAMMLERMNSEKYHLHPSVVLSHEGTDILKKLLKPNPAQRINLEQVGLGGGGGGAWEC